MHNILDKIIEHKKQEVAQRKREVPLSAFINKLKKSERDFANAIKHKDDKINIIAEIKFASPSEGTIRKDADVRGIAGIYDKYVSAISVLTDEKFFSGNLKFIEIAKEASSLPILGKEFIIDEYQIYELRRYGADAVLLIASVLTVQKIKKFISIADSLKMNCIVEVHNENELKKALAANAQIIGINNRNLRTFRVDLNTTLALAKKIPKGKIIISESGINKIEDFDKLRGKVDAVLVGTALMKEKDIEAKIMEFAGYCRD